MIQARLLETILRDLPPGTPTAPLLDALREGRVVPDGFAAWMLRNGWEADTRLQLLPSVVPAPPPDSAELDRRDRRRDRACRRWGYVLLSLSLVIPLLIGFGFQNTAGPNRPWSPAYLLAGVSCGFIVWLGYGCLPLVLVLSGIGLRLNPTQTTTRILLGEKVLLSVLFLASPSLLLYFGFALLARSRGLSPWLGLLGPVSLFFRARGR